MGYDVSTNLVLQPHAFARNWHQPIPDWRTEKNVQYLKSYQSALADRGLVQSMSRKGNCLDNAVMENFFGHLKEEMYYRRDYRSVEELENAVNEYITYWNQKRIKLSLGGLSPVEYRTEYQKAG